MQQPKPDVHIADQLTGASMSHNDFDEYRKLAASMKRHVVDADVFRSVVRRAIMIGFVTESDISAHFGMRVDIECWGVGATAPHVSVRRFICDWLAKRDAPAMPVAPPEPPAMSLKPDKQA